MRKKRDCLLLQGCELGSFVCLGRWECDVAMPSVRERAKTAHVRMITNTCDVQTQRRAVNYKAVPRSKLSRILAISILRGRIMMAYSLVYLSKYRPICTSVVTATNRATRLTFLLNTLFLSLIYVTASSESSFFFLFVLPILRVSARSCPVHPLP